MSNSHLGWITNFIWDVPDDVLGKLYARGKYRDVVLPMTMLRWLDPVLEPSEQAIIDMKTTLDKARITNHDAALRQATKHDEEMLEEVVETEEAAA
jgi:type I restriction enzyme M protein